MILSSSTIEAVVEELRRIADAPGVAALIVALTSLKPGDRLIIARDETEIYDDLISWRATLKYRTDNGRSMFSTTWRSFMSCTTWSNAVLTGTASSTSGSCGRAGATDR